MEFTWPWENFWQDLQDLLLWIPRKLFELLLDGLAWVLKAIPVPDFVASAGGLLSSLPDGITWGFYLFNFSFGVGVVVAAYALRFLIRRLPFIG